MTIAASAPPEVIYSMLAADEDMAELITFFVDAVPDRITALELQLRHGDLEQLERSAYQLMDAVDSYGFRQVKPAVARVAQVARENGPEDELREALDELSELCSRLPREKTR